MESPKAKTKTVKRASVACTACRQVKLRCDVKATFPKPCSRCKTTSRACEINPSFKRTSTRNQLEKVTQELSNLQKHLRSPKEPGSSISSHSGPVESINDLRTEHEQYAPPTTATRTPAAMSDSYFEPGNAFGIDGTAPLGASFALKTVNLSHEEILQLFTFFSHRMYHTLPILDTTITFDRIYRDAPLLFWTIIITASQYHKFFTHLIPLLRPPYEELLGRSITTAPIQLHVIQAVLLLCHWPLPCQRQSADPSWNLWGLVNNAARTQRFNSQVFRAKSTVQSSIWARIWLASFTVGVSLALHAGIEPPFYSLSDIKYIQSLLETTILPSQLATRIEISLSTIKYMMLCSPQSSVMLQISTIKLFEAELDVIKQRYANTWAKESEIKLQQSKLSMYSMACIVTSDNTQFTGSRYENNDVEFFKLSGLQAAARLLYKFSDLVDEATVCPETETETSENDGSKRKVCIPKTYHQAAAYATFFLFKFCVFNESLASQDRSLAENMIKVAYRVSMRLSTHPTDEAARAAKLVNLLGKQTNDTSRTKDHQCTSIVYDALQRADDIRGRPPGYQLREENFDDSRYEAVDLKDQASLDLSDLPAMEDLEDLLSFPAFLNEFGQFYDVPELMTEG